MSGSTERDLIATAGLLFEAANYLQREITQDVERETGMPGPWFATLVRLWRTNPHGVRMSDMAARVYLPPSSFSRLVDRIEAEGLVERVADPTHRRATLLRLTPAGHQRVTEAIAAYEPAARARLADHLSEAELDALERITRKIRDANRPNDNPAAPDSQPSAPTATRRSPRTDAMKR